MFTSVLATAAISLIAGESLAAAGTLVARKIARRSARAGLLHLARQYNGAPKRTQTEWDEYALQHCSPDAWLKMKESASK